MPFGDRPLSSHDASSEDQPAETQLVRRRVRKRRTTPPPERRRWLWVPLLGGALLLVAVLAGLLVRDAVQVRDSLVRAQASLQQVREAAGDLDVEAAQRSLADADEQLAVARNRIGGPLWSLAARLPVTDDSVAVTRGVVAVATASLDVADAALTDGSRLVAGGLDVDVEAGRVDLAPLDEAARLLDGLPTGRLAEARGRLADLEVHWVPDQVAEGRDDALRLAGEALDSIETGRTLTGVLPAFLGEDEPRRYFLGMQTSAELRGTGGMIGYWAVLEIDDGAVTLARTDVHDAEDLLPDGADEAEDPTVARIGELGGDPWDGVAVPEDFQERYEHVAAAGHFSNVNVHPHLPTTAPVILDLFENRAGDALDGVILIDPVGLQAVLEAIGADLEVPADLATDGVPEIVAADGFAEFALADVYEIYGQGHSSERKALLRGLGDAAFAEVFEGAWDGAAVSRAIGQSAGERHLQVFSRDEDEQAAFEALNAAGAMPRGADTDVLAVTANNAVGGKQDVHVGHRTSVEVTLGTPGRAADGSLHLERDATVGVTVDNPLPAEGRDLYVIGNCHDPERRAGCFEGPPGQNRTWFSVWGPSGTRLLEARGDDGSGAAFPGEIDGLHVIDRYLDTPPQDSAGFEVDVVAKAPLRIEGGALVYELTWWSQSKATPDLLEVRVAAPDGWRVRDVTLTGGGDGRGMGVHGDGQSLAVEADGSGSSAHVTGTVSADATLRVELVGAED